MLANHPRIRLAIYLIGLLVAVVAPLVSVAWPEYGAAAVTAAGVLLAAVGVTAATNVQVEP